MPKKSGVEHRNISKGHGSRKYGNGRHAKPQCIKVPAHLRGGGARLRMFVPADYTINGLEEFANISPLLNLYQNRRGL